MTRVGYLGTDKVFVDNCRSCNLMWIDEDELPLMCVLYAQSSTAQLRRQELERQLEEEWRKLTDVAMYSKAVEQAFLLGFVVGRA